MIVQVNSTHPFGDEKPARSVGPGVRELGDHDREAYESDRKQHWRKVEPLPRAGSRGNSAHTLRTPARRPRMNRITLTVFARRRGALTAPKCVKTDTDATVPLVALFVLTRPSAQSQCR